MSEKTPKKKRIRLLQFPITNEVIPQRLYPALLELSDTFEMTAFAGTSSEKEIQKRLENEIIKRESYPKKWRAKQTETEIQSLHLMKDAIERGMPYFQVKREECTLPREAYDLCDAVFVGSNNLTHVSYVLDAIKHDKHFLCEKPYAVTKKDLKTAKAINRILKHQRKNSKENLTGKITAHFAHKPAFLKLLEIIDNLTEEYGKIKKVKGFYEEFDDPKKPRTIATLDSQRSGGGIYQDTGCHLEMMLLALRGEVEETTNFKWANYPGFGVDTYANVSHKIKGTKKRFTEDTEAEFTVSKFADKYLIPLKKENKKIILELETGYETHVLLSKGKIKIKEVNEEIKTIQEIIAPEYPSNEYKSVLKNFAECIHNGEQSFTNPKRGIQSMKQITSDSKRFLSSENRIRVYQ